METVPEGINESELDDEMKDDFSLAPVGEGEEKFNSVLKNVLPYLGSSEGKIVLAEVLIALKIEGIIGNQLSVRDTKMVKAIKESIMVLPERKQEAIQYAKKLLSKSKEEK
jgi:hypothetical protein